MTTWTHLVRFVAEDDGQEHYGQLVDTSRDIGLDSLNGETIKAYKIDGDQWTGKVTDQVLTVKKLLNPITIEQCNYIRCVGLNYVDHAKEAGLDLPSVPTYFAKPRTTLADPYPAPISVPKIAQDGSSDYESELAIIISKTGRDIPESAALSHVLGYTAANDVSARTQQFLTSQWTYSKSLDKSCPMGPVLVSPSVLKEGSGLEITGTHNGNVVQKSSTSSLIFGVSKLVSFFSQGTTLEAGSVIVTGTPSGIGWTRTPRVILKDGDEFRVFVEGVGTLVNKVAYE